MNAPETTALRISRTEHRALAAVINSMESMIGEIRAGRMKPDFRLFWGMVHYIDAFPDRLHHPGKDDWVFDRTRLRTIAKAGTQHRTGGQPGALRECLGDFEAGVTGALDGLDAAIKAYAEYAWPHVHLDEQELQPSGEVYLIFAN